MNNLEQELRRAAEATRSAQALLIAAGAGMGVDSGLPDFRGPEGFWKAYPPFSRTKVQRSVDAALVSDRPGAGLGVLRAPAESVSSRDPSCRISDPASLGRANAAGLLCLHE
jgi:NAD-dependent SIR2 family protein deacetylase